MTGHHVVMRHSHWHSCEGYSPCKVNAQSSDICMCCSGVPAETDVIAVAPILAPEDNAKAQTTVAARPSRKRMEPGADAPGSASSAAMPQEGAQGASEEEPRRPKRRLLTGMAVVWKYFGVKDPDIPNP
jgi:hypothetical protein